MFIPTVYSAALCMLIVSMICWGSWANTQRLCKGWRFELFNWDFLFGILLMTLVLGFTLGRTAPASPHSFVQNLRSADSHHLLLAFLGGVIFAFGSIMIVAAIAIAGLAVAFPVGVGLALVIGSVLNYIITPKGNPLLLFGGILLVCIAIALDALAYRRQTKDLTVTVKGIVVSVLGGVGVGLFYPFIAKAIKGENHLGPYTVALVFALAALVINFPLNYLLMRRPVSGPQLSVRDYFRGAGAWHFWGIFGGMFWGVGMVFSFVASYAQMVGPAVSYALSQGATMVATIWGVFVWKEFKGADATTKRLLALMFALFIIGLVCVALAPVLRW
jgi:glucose uptake protein